MHAELLQVLCCASCSRPFFDSSPDALRVLRADSTGHVDEILDGAVVCAGCGAWFPIDDGLLDLRPLPLQPRERRQRMSAALGLPGDEGEASAADAHKVAQEAFFTRELEGYERDVVGSRFYQALDANTVHRWGRLVPDGARVLDVGGGSGRASRPLAARGCHVVVLDLTEPLLRRAQQRARAEGLTGRTDFVLGDAEHLPFLDATFDAALAHGVLHHLDRPEAVISRVGHALRPGGRWFSLDPNLTPLRAVFDGAMRLVPLWEEEAAESPLQDRTHLLGWCDAAGIDGEAQYTCYVLPHLVSWLPPGAIRRILDATDAVFSRAAGIASWAGVVVVSGVRRGAPPVHVPPVRRGRRAALAAAIVLLLAALSGSWKVDTAVAAQSDSYYMGGLRPMLEFANVPERSGAVMLYPDGRPLEQDTLDDIGYLLGAQLLSAAGVHVTASVLAQVHVLLFLAGGAGMAAAVAAALSSTAGGVFAGGAALVVGRALRQLMYGQVTNQSITAVFPPYVFAAIALLAVTVAIPRGRRLLAAAVAGLLTGFIDLARHAHGLAVIGTFVTWLPWIPPPRVRVAGAALALVAGLLVATSAFPAVLKVNRDRVIGRTSTVSDRLERPPSHHIFYTLLTGVGRYPNALGLKYEDASVDAYIARAAEVTNVDDAIVASRRLFFDYVRNHTVAYAYTVARGAAEIPAFIAYTSFTAERRWDLGWPGIVPGLRVDSGDRALYGTNLLMNVRWNYVNATAPQWILFVAAWAALLGATAASVRRHRWPADGLAIGAALYVAWVALPRVLIPVQGIDLVVTFWLAAGLSGAALLAWRPDPNPY